jgi:integrase
VGTVFKKTFTKPLPADAELFTREGEQFAKWKDSKGKTRKALVTASKEGEPRILIEAKTYTAKYRDGGRIVREVSTGCRDEQAARSVLADLERQAERIRTKIITAQEAGILSHQETALDQHRTDYLAHLQSNGCSKAHRDNVGRQLKRLFDECRFATLAEMDRHTVEKWLNAKAAADMGARTRNSYLTALIAFGNWCADPNVGRMTGNPFARMGKANEKADCRRQRRSMTEPELVSLLDVARRRPLLDAMTVRKGKRKGEAYAKLRDATKETLDWLGRERALTYKTLVLTGLRRGELASLTIGGTIWRTICGNGSRTVWNAYRAKRETAASRFRTDCPPTCCSLMCRASCQKSSIAT